LHRGSRANRWVVDNKIGNHPRHHYKDSWKTNLPNTTDEESIQSGVGTLAGEASACAGGSGRRKDWVPNLPLLQEMLIASAIIEGKCEDSLEFSNYANAHIFEWGIDQGGNDLIDMTHYINREKGKTGEWCIPGAVLKNGVEKYDNIEKTILSKDRNEVYKKQQDGRYHFIDISLIGDDNKPAEDARSFIVEFATCSIPGFETIRLEVLMSILPEHVIYSDPELLKQDFCNMATYAKVEGREDVNRVDLDCAMVICHISGRFWLELGMKMVKFEKT
jgi:hypothetical protein